MSEPGYDFSKNKEYQLDSLNSLGWSDRKSSSNHSIAKENLIIINRLAEQQKKLSQSNIILWAVITTTFALIIASVIQATKNSLTIQETVFNSIEQSRLIK